MEDGIFEYDETFSAVLSTEDPGVMLANYTTVITILDEDNGI